VVNYSVTNTSPQTIEPALSAQLHVKGADGKTEVYEETDVVTPPHDFEEVPPHGLLLSQFIFDVPTEVEPELLAVAEEAATATSSEVGVVDLRESDPQGPRPEEILALHYEYFNMGEYERAYDLFAQESKERVSEQMFVSKNEQDDQKTGGYSFTQYSFPSVEIEGDHATMQVVRTSSDQEESELQEEITQEAVLEDEGWRIVMREDQYEYFGG
jgi:hypothetical protein